MASFCGDITGMPDDSGPEPHELNAYDYSPLDYERIGKHIKAMRDDIGISQKRLAEWSGVSRTYISMIENGDAENVSLAVIANLANALSVSVVSLLYPPTDDTVSVLKLTSGGKVYYVDIDLDTMIASEWMRLIKAICRLGHGTFEVVEMTLAEYQSIPATIDSAEVFAG